MGNTGAGNGPSRGENSPADREKRAPVSSSKSARKRSAKADRELDRAFLAKAAAYAGGMSGGVGIKALNRDLLLAEMDHSARQNALKGRVARRIARAIAEAGISYGVDEKAVAEAVDAFLETVEEGSDRMVARKVATGAPPRPGEDGRLDYLLNPDNLPMHQVTGVPPTSKKRWFRMVHQGETLVQVFPSKPGEAGRSVGDGPIEAAKPEEVSLGRVIGANTAIDGDRLIAGSDGACEESATGRVRVVPEVVVDAVDAATGSLPEAGVGKANVLVKGDIRSGYGVFSSENVFVGAGSTGGVVEQKAQVAADNLAVNGTILGTHGDAAGETDDPNMVDVQEVCVAREIDGRHVTAGQILVSGDSRLALLDADEAIRVDGDLVGGEVIVRGILTVGGDMGSEEGGSHMRVIVPQSGGPSRRHKRLATAFRKQKRMLAELQKKLGQLDATAKRRARFDPYWALLFSDDFREPRSPREANTLRQFRDMLNEKKGYQRSVGDVRLTMRRIQEQAGAEAEASGASGVCIRVAGHLYLDVSFEVTVEAKGEALESQVTYMEEGNERRNCTLRDIHSELAGQARDHLEIQSDRVEERRHAIDEMFRDAEHRPTGPQVKHKRFELPFAWDKQDAEGEGEAGAFQVSTTAFMDTSESERLFVRTFAVAREVLEGAEISISQEGPEIDFFLGRRQPSQVRWQRDSGVLQTLSEIVIRGSSARELMDKAAF